MAEPVHSRRTAVRAAGDVAATAVGRAALNAQLVDLVDAALIGLALDGAVTSWNAAAESMFRVSAAEVLGRPLEDVDGSVRGADGVRQLAAALSAPEPVRELTLGGPAGEPRELTLTVAPILDDKGEVVGSAAMLRDVTVGNQLLRERHLDQIRHDRAQALAHVGSFEGDLLTRTYWWSEEYLRLLGRDPGDPITDMADYYDLVHPDDLAMVRESYWSAIRGETSAADVEHRVVLPDGAIRWLRVHGEVGFDPDGTARLLAGTAMDVTELHRAEGDRLAAEEKLRLGFELSPVGMAMSGLDHRFTVVNPALCRMLGLPPQDIIGRDWQEFVVSDHRPTKRRRSDVLLEGAADTFSAEYQFSRADGRIGWVENSVTLVHDPDGTPAYFFAQMTDVTERKLAEERLSHQAFHDPLTGLPNRVLLADRISQALARSGRLRGHVVTLFLDLDQFKIVNDGLGHAAGDLLLVQFAARLRAALRTGDTLARFGGDEFVIVYDDVSPFETGRLGDRIAETLRAPFDIEGREIFVTASIGIAVASRNDTPVTMLRNSDAAMYQAKARGRARAVVFDDAMHETASARIDTEAGLRRALDNGELLVHYQPIMDMVTEQPIGLEALVRWQHPTRGIVGPAEFIPVAEETGLIVPLGAWVLAEALRTAQACRTGVAGCAALSVAVNLSARQLQARDLLQTVSSAISAAGIDASAVDLEITESLVMNDVELSIETLVALRALGVGLAVDDFGTGYSSLSYLKRLPVDTLKIDQSFVDGLGGVDPHDSSIVHAVINLARALDLKVIAEGVESIDQRDELRRLGISRAQGYLWARPMPAEEIYAWLVEKSASTTIGA